MSLLDEYLNAPSSKTSTTAKSSNSLIDEYLNIPDQSSKPQIKSAPLAAPRPPISGADKETSDELNARPSIQGDRNPRSGELIEGIKNIPSNIKKSVSEDFASGLNTVGEGVSDIISNKPATGVGKVGLGALSSLVSPITGTSKELIEKPITEATGSKELGEKAGIVATSGLPIAKAGKAAVAQIPKNKALSTLIESVGPENAGAVAKAMRENPRLSPADLSPRVKQDVQHLFVTEGPHINYLSDQVAKRSNTAKDAVEGIIDAGAGGAAVNAAEKLDKLKQNIKDIGSKEINPVIKNSKPVDLTDTIKNIDEILKPGVMSKVSIDTDLALPEVKKAVYSVKQYLSDNKSVRTDPDELNRIQSMLRRHGEKLLQSSDGGARSQGAAIMKIRNDIVNAIDTASGGKYKEALSKYRDETHVQDAFEHGYESILKNSKSLQDRPEFFERWVKNATPAELEAAREGARLAFDTQINGFKFGARKGTDIGEVEFNKRRIEALFDKKEAEKMFKDLKHERTIADTDNKIIQGSQTAMRSASKQAFELPTKSEIGKNLLPAAVLEASSAISSGTPGIGSALFLGAKGAITAKDKIALKLAKERNSQYAKYAMPVEGLERDTVIKALEDAAIKQSSKKSLARRVTSGAARLGNLIAP